MNKVALPESFLIIDTIRQPFERNEIPVAILYKT